VTSVPSAVPFFARTPIGVRVVPLAALFVALGPLSTDVYLPLLPQVATTFDASDAAATATITAVLLGLAVGQLLGGPMSDQRGRRPVLLVGLALFVVTTALSALAPSMALLIAIRFAAGIAAALSFVVARAMVADSVHALELARGYALLGAITGVAPVVAPIIGGILALFLDWRGVFMSLAAIGVLIFLIAYVKVPETMPVEKRGESGFGSALTDLGSLVKDRSFMSYVLMLACAGGMLFAYIGSSAFVLENGYGLSPTAYGAVFALNSLGIFTMALIGRKLVRRVGPSHLLWSGQWLTLTGSMVTLAALLAHSLPGILMGLFISIAPNTWNFANATAIGFEIAPARAGSASAILGISGFLVGGLLAPLGSLGGAAMGVLMVAFTATALVLHRFMAPRPATA
jgi:MFS transporter, DHA1 family, multidrug resistance protein